MTWHAKATGWGYSRTSTEAYDNAVEIYNALSSFGWTRQAVCAAIGNCEHEGIYNPWQWEADNPMRRSQWRYWTATSRGGNSDAPADYDAKDSSGEYLSPMRHGYGLWGFTPADKYLTLHSDVTALPSYAPNFRDVSGRPSDGYAQCYYLHYHGEWNRARLPDALPVVYSIQEFSQLTYSINVMAGLFVYGYEGPWWYPEYKEDWWNKWTQERAEAARYWNEHLPGSPSPPGPEPPTPGTLNKIVLLSNRQWWRPVNRHNQ